MDGSKCETQQWSQVGVDESVMKILEMLVGCSSMYAWEGNIA